MAYRSRRELGEELELLDLQDDFEKEKVQPAVSETIMEEKPEPVRKEKAPVKKKKRKMKNRRSQLMVRVSVLAVVLFCILGSGIYCIVDRVKDKDSVGCRLYIDGENISWLTVEEAADKVQSAFQDTKINFSENGKDIYTVSLGEAGYSLDRDQLVAKIQEIKDQRSSCHMIFEKRKDISIPYEVLQDDEKKKEAFANEHMDNGSERIPSVDAKIVLNEDTKYFEIVPSSLGTVIDNKKLLKRISDTLEASLSKDLIQPEISVAIDTDIYKEPKLKEDQDSILDKLSDNNRKVDDYATASVTYKFGKVKEKLTNDMIREWIVIQDGDITLDEAAMRDYIKGLGLDYNTQYVPRKFTTSYGEDIIIENNEYGYWIDEDGEYEQLVKDIESGEQVKRTPVYSSVGYKRNGNDDLFAGYVEVNLTDQRLWLYVDGQEILSTEVVTGQPTGVIDPKTGLPEDRSTYEGSYPISYKEKDATLSSEIYGYEQKVEYWMPFVYGQGLHDAGWRPEFGGTIYMWDGSHGCVNLPTYEASVIFSYVDENFPVILYKTGPDPEVFYDPSIMGTGYADPNNIQMWDGVTPYGGITEQTYDYTDTYNYGYDVYTDGYYSDTMDEYGY